jgi:hypothetical protein
MPAIPRLNQYYPGIPLNELTNLYSVGDNRFPDTPASGGRPAVTHRVCLLSYLPRTLFVHDGLPFNNKYTVLLENMQNIQTIIWDHELFLNGVRTDAGNFIRTANPSEFEYDIYFQESMVDDNGLPRFDKIKITCKLDDGASNVIDLFVYHDLARATNVIERTDLDTGSPFGGNPDAFNIVSNQLKEYYSEALLTWNGHQIEANRDNNEALLKIVLAIIYYNIQYSGSMTSEASLSFDFNDFSPLQLKRCINTGAAYNGHFKTGLCQIPLHVLSDVLPPDTSGLPDYTQINTANPVYSIFEANQLLTYNNLESEVLLTIPDKLQRMRDRMVGNIPRLTDLYYLSTFPKPAIRMAAMLIKYLFESSKRNSCKECLNKDDRWLNSTLAILRDYPNFLKNILTHYFREPYNKIEEFAPEAIRATTLTFSPYIHSLIHNVAPRILKAYFAKRKVTRTATGEYWVEFERLGNDMLVDVNGIMVNEQNVQLVNAQNQPQAKPAWDSFLGREFLLVVETWGSNDEDITCRLHPSANLFTVGLNGGNLQVQADGNFVTDIQKRTGLFDSLNINTNALPGTAYTAEYLRVNHSGKTIVKIRLRPQTAADFATWTNNLGINPLTLGIVVQRSDNTACLFGSDTSQTRASDEFLTATDRYDNRSRFRIANRIVYEIHHSTNPWNVLHNNRRIGSITNDFINGIADSNVALLPFRLVHYFYYDEWGCEHDICACQLHKPHRRRDGRIIYRRSTMNNPNAFLNNYPANGNHFYYRNNPPPGQQNMVDINISNTAQPIVRPIETDGNNLGESREKYYASHDGVTAYPAGRKDEYDQIIVRGINNNAVVSYEIDPNRLRVEIVRMPDGLNYPFSLGSAAKLIRYTFLNTERKFANPGCFGAFIGVLAQLNFNDVISTGMCFDDATSYPSTEHPNGDSIDTGHLNTTQRRNSIIGAFRDWHFTNIISGDSPIYINDNSDSHNSAHNNHLHAGNFDVNTVVNIII